MHHNPDFSKSFFKKILKNENNFNSKYNRILENFYPENLIILIENFIRSMPNFENVSI